MTPQEIFDTVCKHLGDQGIRAIHDSSQCAYLNRKGHRCAVGHLLPADARLDILNSKLDVQGLIINFDIEIPFWFTVNRWLLVDIQRAHDTLNNWSNTECLRNAFKNIARTHNLDDKVVQHLVVS